MFSLIGNAWASATLPWLEAASKLTKIANEPTRGSTIGRYFPKDGKGVSQELLEGFFKGSGKGVLSISGPEYGNKRGGQFVTVQANGKANVVRFTYGGIEHRVDLTNGGSLDDHGRPRGRNETATIILRDYLTEHCPALNVYDNGSIGLVIRSEKSDDELRTLFGLVTKPDDYTAD